MAATKTAPAKPAKKTVDPRPCACGCGKMLTSKKGVFAPGHDARHCSNLAKRVAAKELTRAKALAEAGKASEALRNKLTTMLDNAAKRAEAKKAKPVPATKAQIAKALDLAIGSPDDTENVAQ